MESDATTARRSVDQVDGGRAVVAFTTTAAGDLAPPRRGQPDPATVARWRQVVDRPWTWLRQVHRARVVTVVEPGDGAGSEADASVTVHPGAALAVFTADCAPIALLSHQGPVAAVHAGWRGLVAGVVEAAVERVRHLGGDDVVAVVGPCIRPWAYEFGAEDLDRVAAQLGDEVRATTADGTPALDLAAGAAAVLERAGIHEIEDLGICTAASPHHWSFRAEGTTARQATVVFRERT